VVRKEFLHIVRDPRTLVVIVLIPIIQLVLMGYAATTDIEHLRTVVLDRDRSADSRALIDSYRASGYFEITAYAENEDEVGQLIDRGDARAGLMIPTGYGRELAAGRVGQVGFVIDGSDPAVANTILGASQSVGQAMALKLVEQQLGGKDLQVALIEVRPRVWYNPELKSVNYMIPALMGMILQFLATMLTALAVVRERELGTLEQLMVTPIQPIELVIGKVLPYVVVAFLTLIEVLTFGVLWFDVPIHGSVLLLLVLSGLFLFTSLGLGLLISTVAHTQQEAMLISWLFLLPSIFLSGFFFPIDAMPTFLQVASLFVPLRYLLTIIRGIVLKGVGLEAVAMDVIALIVFGVAVIGLAAWRFNKRVE
jgi:ABC-2 type transport system permease protein